MSLESPITYAEWYWKHRVDVEGRIGELSEAEIAPLLRGVINDIPTLQELPDGLRNLLNFAAEPTGQYVTAMLLNTGAEIVGGTVAQSAKPLTRHVTYAAEKLFQSLKIDASMASTLFARNKIDIDIFNERLAWQGFNERERDFAFEGVMPYPTIPDIMTWARYHGDYKDINKAVLSKFRVHDDDFHLWEWLTYQRITTIQAQDLLKRGIMDDDNFFDEIGRIGWQDIHHKAIKDLAYILPNSMLLVQGGLMQGLNNETILENISKGDIHPDYAQTYLDAVLTKPASQDIVAYQLRKDSSLSVLDTELKKIGIHPKYTDIYKELAYQIPPVADIITMAVREAFSPEIAAKFGQYEDFPDELEDWGTKKGLAKEWTQRYWAAHWALPSPQQGFEMLHRGVIDHTELNMLLRAQDVMPFWRDKLIQIAYRRLTRVDIRRMYKEGVLTEKDVFESYLEHGYNTENAERMTEFTIKQTLTTLSKFTSGDIIKAYSSRMINRGTAIALLRDIGVRTEDANYIVSTAEYKRQWAFTDEQIAGIRNLYKKRMYDENQARDKLARLNLPADQITVLMQQWHYEKIEELDATWTTAQTLKFLKRKLISPDRARQELNLNGYTDERIDIYLRDMQWTPPKE